MEKMDTAMKLTIKKLATTTPIRNTLRDTAYSQTVSNNNSKLFSSLYQRNNIITLMKKEEL